MTTAGADVTAALARVVGPGHVRTGEAAVALAVDGVGPRWAVSPGTVAEVSACLALAASHRLAVAPTGGGARLSWGSVPPRLDLVLSLARLARVLSWEPADLTMSVEAGVSLAALDAHVRGGGQMLPLDPPRPEATTVGGAIATGSAGPYRARYGTIRELVLGLTVVQGDGTVVRGGGRVVKNVTGYDVPKVHVGALGTLGVVVEVHLRLHPVPAEEGTWVFGFPGPEAALDAAVALRETTVLPSRLQLVDGTTAGALGGPVAAATLATTVGSVPEAVRRQGERVAEVCRRAGGEGGRLDAAARWWAGVRGAALPVEPDGLTLRIGTRPGDVVKALRAVEAVAGRAGLAVTATAELANGILHAGLAGPGLARAPAVLARLRGELVPLSATCVVEHAPREVKAGLDVWGDPGPGLALMRRLKAELDPGGVLNPGRFVGGI